MVGTKLNLKEQKFGELGFPDQENLISFQITPLYTMSSTHYIGETEAAMDLPKVKKWVLD
jgi:hypothetical protein